MVRDLLRWCRHALFAALLIGWPLVCMFAAGGALAVAAGVPDCWAIPIGIASVAIWALLVWTLDRSMLKDHGPAREG